MSYMNVSFVWTGLNSGKIYFNYRKKHFNFCPRPFLFNNQTLENIGKLFFRGICHRAYFGLSDQPTVLDSLKTQKKIKSQQYRCNNPHIWNGSKRRYQNP